MLHPATHQIRRLMSSVASFNASNESPHEEPIQLPPRLSSPTLVPLSPHTVHTTLQAQSNINTGLLRGIANGLLQTIVDREASTSVAAKWYKDCIHNLEQHVLHYEETFNEPPAMYELNNGKVSNFHIPVGDRLYQEAKWIRLNDDGTVSRYHSTQGPNEQPHIIDLYATLDYSIDSPLCYQTCTLMDYVRKHLRTDLGTPYVYFSLLTHFPSSLRSLLTMYRTRDVMD
jgi:hypothetical protein